MKHAKSQPKVLPAMPVYTPRLLLQRGMTTPIVIGKQNSRGEFSNMQRSTFLSCLSCSQMQKASYVN